MTSVREQSKEQGRWNQYGTQQVEEILKNPGKYVIRKSPIGWLAASGEIMRILGPLEGKRILELGCGFGRFSVFLAQQGANVTGVDIGPDLVAASNALAKVNQVDCEFQTANIVSLPFESKSYDIVIGKAVLHHLSTSDVSKALSEAYRLLNEAGIAIFLEPVENSKLFDLIQNLFPAGERGSRRYRPSILQRGAWNEYIRLLDDRSMTNRELVSEGKKHFQSVRISPYGFLVRLTRLIGKNHRQTLRRMDEVIFRILPPLGWLSQTVLVEYRKSGRIPSPDLPFVQ
jgi:2-polyprenyl-3-methyl-5-hydroxy-6-metoxy-1,4-benzoquinol methylase